MKIGPSVHYRVILGSALMLFLMSSFQVQDQFHMPVLYQAVAVALYWVVACFIPWRSLLAWTLLFTALVLTPSLMRILGVDSAPMLLPAGFGAGAVLQYIGKGGLVKQQEAARDDLGH